MSDKPLVNKEYLLQKFPGKGGWTYAAIPEVTPNSDTPFGWLKVKGTIDDFELRNTRLAPMGNGRLFLPVKKEIRRQIKKDVGQYVRIVLYADHQPIETPGEFLLCLQDDPDALQFFTALEDSEKQHYLNWIYSAKREETKIERMARAIDSLSKQLKYYEN